MDIMEKKERINWIDLTKGFGILCIMLAHVVQYFDLFSSVNSYVCSFHVPIFFVLAGCMDGIFGEKHISIQKRTVQLLIPYFVFSCINSAVKLGVLAIRHMVTSAILKDEAIAFFITGNGTVWFLLTLWVLNILVDQVKKAKLNDWVLLAISIGLLLFLYYVPLNSNPFFILLVRVIGALGYWGIGYVFIRITRYEKYAFIKAILFILVGAVIENLFVMKIDFFSGVFYNGLVAIPVSIAGSLGFISFMIAFDTKKQTGLWIEGLLYLGKHSLVVMLVHPLILQCVMYPFGNHFKNMQGIKGYGMALLIYVCIVLLVLPFIRFLNGKGKWLLGKRG